MSTRVLRDEHGLPRRGPTQLIRTKQHVCGRKCPLHEEPRVMAFAQALADQLKREFGQL